MENLIRERVHNYYWQHDFSCVITTLKILSEIFSIEIHPQLFKAAFALNAGRSASQCGLVEGTLLFMGAYAGKKRLKLSEIQELSYRFSQKFQQKFSSVLCSELRPQGFAPENPPHLCESLTKSAITFSAEFISKNMADTNTLSGKN